MTRISRLLKSFAKCERGAVLPLVALLIIFLFGMAALTVDAGGLYAARREMVNTADAAALAGAQELIYAQTKNLSTAQVEQYAEDFARDNFHGELKEVEATVTLPSTVKVRTVVEVDYTFGRVLGLTTSEVPAYAVATFNPLVDANHIVPWAVPEGFLPDNWDKEECIVCEGHPDDCNCCQWCGADDRDECGCDGVVVLQTGPPGGGGQSGQIGPGNFHSLALTGPGANVYCEDIKHGYDGTISIGDCLETQTGDIVGKTKEGVEYRIEHCCEKYNETTKMCDDTGCPRYVTTPVFDETETDVQGKGCVKVIGFATFYLIDYIHQGPTHEVHAYFVPGYIASGTGSGDFDSGIDFGTYNLRLIE